MSQEYRGDLFVLKIMAVLIFLLAFGQEWKKRWRTTPNRMQFRTKEEEKRAEESELGAASDSFYSKVQSKVRK